MRARLIWGYAPSITYRFYQHGPNWLTFWVKPVALQVWWGPF